MSDKFNELIELIISEETDQAKALFHDIVVDKSRSIYESLIDETEEEEETEEDEELEESDFDEDLGGDAAEEFIDDISADEEGLALEDEGEEEEMEDRVVDLEDALDELKAEFEKMMAGEEGEEDDMDMDMEPEMDDMEMDMEPEEDEEDEAEEDDMEETFVREYKEKVAAPSNTSEKHSSPVAKKNPMNANGAKATSTGSSAAETGAAKVTAKVEDAGNGNKPGAKSDLKKA